MKTSVEIHKLAKKVPREEVGNPTYANFDYWLKIRRPKLMCLYARYENNCGIDGVIPMHYDDFCNEMYFNKDFVTPEMN